MSEPVIKKSVSTNGLRSVLAERYGKKPSYSRLKMAISRGMPAHQDPIYGTTRFYVEDVIRWIEESGGLNPASISADARKRARTTT